MADFWSLMYDALKYQGTAISQNPALQVAVAQNTAQASTSAPPATEVKQVDTARDAAIAASDDAMIKQASAASAGLTSNILTGARGVDRDKEKTSAVVLGGSDSAGAGRLGQSGNNGGPGFKTLGGGMGNTAYRPKMMLGRAANG